MNTMKYTVTPESPVDIEISANGETHHISFYPTDLAVRERFYQTYENLKNYKPRGFKVVVDRTAFRTPNWRTQRSCAALPSSSASR